MGLRNFESHLYQFVYRLAVKDALVEAHLMIWQLELLVPQANLPLNSETWRISTIYSNFRRERNGFLCVQRKVDSQQ